MKDIMKNIFRKVAAVALAIVTISSSASVVLSEKAFATGTVSVSKVTENAKSKVGQKYSGEYNCLNTSSRLYSECGINILPRICCAEHYEEILRSENKLRTEKDIPDGAMVFYGNANNIICSTCGRRCGHVGIAVDNGKNLVSQEKVVTLTNINSFGGVTGWWLPEELAADAFTDIGHVDYIEKDGRNISVSGWFVDTADLNYIVKIGILAKCDNGYIKTFTLKCNKERKDVGSVYPSFGNYRGFNTVLDANGLSGRTSFTVYAYDSCGHKKEVYIKTIDLSSSLPVEDGGIYVLTSSLKNYALNLWWTDSTSNRDGQQVTLYVPDGSLEQRWRTVVDGNKVLLYNMRCSNRVLDVYRFPYDLNAGAKLDIWTDCDKEAQTFELVAKDGGYALKLSGKELYITSGGKYYNGATLYLTATLKYAISWNLSKVG